MALLKCIIDSDGEGIQKDTSVVVKIKSYNSSHSENNEIFSLDKVVSDKITLRAGNLLSPVS